MLNTLKELYDYICMDLSKHYVLDVNHFRASGSCDEIILPTIVSTFKNNLKIDGILIIKSIIPKYSRQ